MVGEKETKKKKRKNKVSSNLCLCTPRIEQGTERTRTRKTSVEKGMIEKVRDKESQVTIDRGDTQWYWFMKCRIGLLIGAFVCRFAGGRVRA